METNTLQNSKESRLKRIVKTLLKLFSIVILMALTGFGVFLYTQNNLRLKTPFYSFDLDLGNQFACETISSTSLFPYPSEDYKKTAGVEGNVSKGSGKMTFQIVKDEQGLDRLNLLTDTSVGAGLIDPLQMLITTNDDKVLVAVATEAANAGNQIVHTVVINKKTNTGVWSKTNEEVLLEFGPYNVASYLLCN